MGGTEPHGLFDVHIRSVVLCGGPANAVSVIIGLPFGGKPFNAVTVSAFTSFSPATEIFLSLPSTVLDWYCSHWMYTLPHLTTSAHSPSARAACKRRHLIIVAFAYEMHSVHIVAAWLRMAAFNIGASVGGSPVATNASMAGVKTKPPDTFFHPTKVRPLPSVPTSGCLSQKCACKPRASPEYARAHPHGPSLYFLLHELDLTGHPCGAFGQCPSLAGLAKVGIFRTGHNPGGFRCHRFTVLECLWVAMHAMLTLI